jgi:hypothetical protein
LWTRTTGLADTDLCDVDRPIGRAPDDLTARYILEIPQFVGAEPDPRAALDTVFDLLEHGRPTTP